MLEVVKSSGGGEYRCDAVQYIYTRIACELVQEGLHARAYMVRLSEVPKRPMVVAVV